MSLNERQRRSFFRDGFVVVPQVVSKAQVDRARRAINMSLGHGVPPEDVAKLRVRSFCPELRASPELMQLLVESPLWSICESLIGELGPGSQGDAQINLRFPVPEKLPPFMEPHLDGMNSPSNGVPSGQLRNFTALVGVMLSDMPEEFCGNFTIWPGTHAKNAAFLREAGARSLLEHMPRIELPEPVQIRGRAGDAVLAHYLLSHGTAPNWGCDIRYMVFFRLVHTRLEQEKWRSLKEVWLHWPGMHDLRGRA